MKVLSIYIYFLLSTGFLFSEPKYCLTGTKDYIKYWDLNSGQCIKKIATNGGVVTSVFISPEGRYALSASANNNYNAQYWDLYTSTCIRTLEGHSGHVQSVFIALDALHTLTGSDDKTIKYWNLQTGECIRTLTGHNDIVNSVEISPDGNYCVSGSNQIKYWNIQTGECLRTISGASETVSFSPDGKHALSGYQDFIKYWNLETGDLMWTINRNFRGVNSVDISPDGIFAFSGNGDESMPENLFLWNMSDGSMKHNLGYFHEKGVLSVHTSKDNLFGLSGSLDYTTRFWDLTAYQCRTILQDDGAVHSVFINPNETVDFKDYKSVKILPFHYFSASPNPFTSRISISSTSPASIYSLTGQLIMNLSKGKHSIDTSKWREGVYIVKSGIDCKRVVKVK